MIILKNLLLIAEVICSVLLIGMVLIQKSKGGGLGGSAFGGAAETVFGARTGNILTKITIGLTIFFMANTLALSFFFTGTQERSLIEADPVVEDVPPVTTILTVPTSGDEVGVPAGLPPEDANPLAPVETAPPVETVPPAEVPAPQP